MIVTMRFDPKDEQRRIRVTRSGTGQKAVRLPTAASDDARDYLEPAWRRALGEGRAIVLEVPLEILERWGA